MAIVSTYINPSIPEKTPVNAVASEGKLTSSGAFAPATHATSEIVSNAME